MVTSSNKSNASHTASTSQSIYSVYLLACSGCTDKYSPILSLTTDVCLAPNLVIWFINDCITLILCIKSNCDEELRSHMSTLTTPKNFIWMSFACLNRKGLSSKDCHIPLLIIDVNKLLVNCCQVSKDCNSTESLESWIVVNVVDLAPIPSLSITIVTKREKS